MGWRLELFVSRADQPCSEARQAYRRPLSHSHKETQHGHHRANPSSLFFELGRTARSLARAERQGARLGSEARSGKRGGGRAATEAALAEVRALEDFFAYPGVRLMKTLAERISGDDALGVGRLARRISGALLSGSYRYDSSEWESSDDDSENVPDRLPFDTSGGTHRPYFETLIVSPVPAANFAKIAQEIRRLRRVEDAMIYEPVLVGSFEDAIVATIMNGKIEAVVIYDGIPVPSRHDVPLIRDFLTRPSPARHIEHRATGSRRHPGPHDQAHPSRARHLSAD